MVLCKRNLKASDTHTSDSFLKEKEVHEDCLDSPDQYSWTASLDTKDLTASVISSDDCNCWCIHHPIKDSPTFFYPFVFASIAC